MTNGYGMRFACWTAVVIGCGSTLLAASLGEIPEIRLRVISNATSLAMPASAVRTNFTILNVCTNGTLLGITAQNVCGAGTNGIFAYDLTNESNLIRVICRDASSNGMDYWYHENYLGGGILEYTEYKGGMNDGIHMTFDTNAVVRLFMNASNNYIVGEGYEFNESGNIIFAQTTSVPTVSLEYRHHPPK